MDLQYVVSFFMLNYHSWFSCWKGPLTSCSKRILWSYRWSVFSFLLLKTAYISCAFFPSHHALLPHVGVMSCTCTCRKSFLKPSSSSWAWCVAMSGKDHSEWCSTSATPLGMRLKPSEATWVVHRSPRTALAAAAAASDYCTGSVWL
jgi:hypothetical protein